MPGTFDASSRAQLNTVDPRLVMVMEKARLYCPFDFFITEGGGARTIAKQREFFRTGASKVDPDKYATRAELYAAAKHVVGPGMRYSRACDTHVGGKQRDGAYDKVALGVLFGLVLGVAKESGVPISIRWGGDFDRDGNLQEIGSFVDMPHFEID